MALDFESDRIAVVTGMNECMSIIKHLQSLHSITKFLLCSIDTVLYTYEYDDFIAEFVCSTYSYFYSVRVPCRELQSIGWREAAGEVCARDVCARLAPLPADAEARALLSGRRSSLFGRYSENAWRAGICRDPRPTRGGCSTEAGAPTSADAARAPPHCTANVSINERERAKEAETCSPAEETR